MRLLILGASGRTGSLAMTYALEKGYTVTVLVRRASAISAQTGLTIVEGSPLNSKDVEAAFDAVLEDPVQAVVVALAASRASDSPFAKPLAPRWFIRDSVRNVWDQMRSHNIKRIVAMSAFGSGSSWSQFSWILKLLFAYSNMSYELQDHNAVDQDVREAGVEWGLEWTLAKPTMLKGEQTKLREFGEDGRGIGLTDSASREGVARWLIDSVEAKANVQKACVLAN